MGRLTLPRSLLVTVEHSSNRLPAELEGLGLSSETLESHVAWDPGAHELGLALHQALGGALIEGQWSRLLVDLNRSSTNWRKIAPARSFGVDIPGNAGLSRDEIKKRVETYWTPFRDQAHEVVANAGACLHVSVHTFTPVLGKDVRDFDLAVLYDPRRLVEREYGRTLFAYWRDVGWKARRNAPYRGIGDGHVTTLRREFPESRYAGLEIEVNQRQLPDWRRVTQAVIAGIEKVLETQKTRP